MSEKKTPGTVRIPGTGLPQLGEFNLTVVLDAIRRSFDGISRVELAGIVGLAPQTVSNLCRRLLDQEMIVEAGKYGNGPGKPRTLLRLNPHAGYALGIHLDPLETTYVLLDLTGSVIAHRTCPTTIDYGPEVTVREIAAEVSSIIDDCGVPRSKIAGLGAAVPGPIDGVNGTILDPPHLPQWDRVELKRDLSAVVGLPVLVDKDVTAAAMGEIWSGQPSGRGSFLFVYLGTGTGTGIVLNNTVVRGSSGNAGNVGVLMASLEAEGLVESFRAIIDDGLPESIVKEARKLGFTVEKDPGAEGIHTGVAMVAEAAKAGDARAREAFERTCEHFALAVAIQANLLDVDHVVFGGLFWQYFREIFLDLLPKRLQKLSVTSDVHEIKVMGTSVGFDVGAVGAACLVLEDTFGPHVGSYLLAAREPAVSL